MALDWDGKEGFNAAPDKDVYTDGSVKAVGQMRSYGKLSFLRVYDAAHMVSSSPFWISDHSLSLSFLSIQAISDQPAVGQDFILKQWLHSHR
jgi:carboxypeptidase C (cathepsin A)